MREQVFRLVIFGLALLAPSMSLAAEPSTAAGLVRDSALESVLQSYSGAMHDMVGESELSDDPTFIRHWHASIDDALDVTRLDPRVASRIDAMLSAGDAALVRDFLESPLGRKSTLHERTTILLSPDETTAAILSGKALLASMSQQRLLLIQSVAALGTADVDRRLVRQTLRVMLVGLSLAAQHGKVGLAWSELDAQAAATAPDLAQNYGQDSLALAAFTYADLTDAELGEYVETLATAPMRHFRAASARAVDSVVEGAVFSFGNRMVERLRSVGI